MHGAMSMCNLQTYDPNLTLILAPTLTITQTLILTLKTGSGIDTMER